MFATVADACREYATNVGAEYPAREWLLTDYDAWVPNPHYFGPPTGVHPEEDHLPDCIVFMDHTEAAKCARYTAMALDQVVRLEHYKDRCWVVWLK